MSRILTSSRLPLLFFVILHIALLNINVAEWGDSYRILRASEHIRNFSYPSDEKRPPLYSGLLALRPSNVDQVMWGRIIMLGVSLLTIYVFTLVLDQFTQDERQKTLALWLFALNPVFLYWSIRIMADVFFALLVLLSFYLYKKRQLALVGLVVGLAVLTRFEGYVLGAAFAAGMFFDRKKIRDYITLGLPAFIVILPWLLYRNPFTSSYFEEPGGREYGLTTAAIYSVSVLFLFGFTSAFYFFHKQTGMLKSMLFNNKALGIFLVLELVLAFAWPAAIPRLFVPIVPFLILFLSLSITEYFGTSKPTFSDFYIPVLLIFIWLGAQFFLKLQFLVLIKWVVLLVFGLQLVSTVFVYKRRYELFLVSTVLSMLVWAMATIYIHKDIFKVVKEANEYVLSNLSGTVAYNDISSVSDWYLNQKSSTDQVSGFYMNLDNKKGRSPETLSEKDPDYLLITNEHNTTMEFSADEVTHLEQIAEFSHTVNSEVFFTKILKVLK